MFVEHQDYTDRDIERQIDELTDRQADKLTDIKRDTLRQEKKRGKKKDHLQ